MDYETAYVRKLEQDRADLLAALKRVMELLNSGVLVRDITKDGGPNWAPRMMELVRDMQSWQMAIAKAEGTAVRPAHSENH